MNYLYTLLVKVYYYTVPRLHLLLYTKKYVHKHVHYQKFKTVPSDFELTR